jgi:single-strand DNA-binding protein
MPRTNIATSILCGTVTRDAELRYIKETPLLAFSLAVNRAYKKGDEWQEDASFFDCEMWGKRAEKLAQYINKGTRLTIQAEPRQDRWEQDGNKRSKVKFVVQQLEFAGGKSESKSDDGFDDSPPF